MYLFETDEQKLRLKKIDNILRNFEEIDIPDGIIYNINKKFKTTKYYNYIRTEEIEVGMIIRTVDLNIKKISTTGIVIKIIQTSSKLYGNIRLYNPSNDIYWNINPDKYYIFQIDKGTNELNRKIKELKNIIRQ